MIASMRYRRDILFYCGCIDTMYEDDELDDEDLPGGLDFLEIASLRSEKYSSVLASRLQAE